MDMLTTLYCHKGTSYAAISLGLRGHSYALLCRFTLSTTQVATTYSIEWVVSFVTLLSI